MELQKRLEKQYFFDVNKMAQFPEQELQEILQFISHDLRAPIRHLKEFHHLLYNEEPPVLNEEQNRFKAYIEESISTIDQQVERLLIYSRLNTRPPKVASISINAIIGTAMRELQEGDNELVKFNYRDGVSLSETNLNTCQFSVSLALKEVLHNALLYSNRKPVEVYIKETPLGVEFNIRDQGVGIQDPELLNEAFKLSRRLQHHAEFPGVGMGLSIAKKSLERVKGEIQLHSNDDQGLSVKIILPTNNENN